MAGRPGSTFQKLQKERARHEKQREKMERRQRRKLEKAAGIQSGEEAISETDAAQLPPADGEEGPQ